MKLLDEQDSGAFGAFFGHPNGFDKSQAMVERILSEFSLNYEHFRKIVLSVPVDPKTYLTKIKPDLTQNLVKSGWQAEPYYPESPRYQTDIGRHIDNRYIFVEVKLSDARRAVNTSFMSRVFRAGYMRLGIYIALESTSPEKGKNFYSMLKTRYD